MVERAADAAQLYLLESLRAALTWAVATAADAGEAALRLYGDLGR